MHRVVSQKFKRGLALAAMAAAALIAGCGGGGTAQIEPFAPTRIIAFGDESGTILQSGKKYTINGLNADTRQVDCRVSPVWTQILAGGFGFVFPQCNNDFVALPQGIMYAFPGAKVADVRDKIDLHLSNDRFGPKDIVAIMVGVNDILELYRQFPAQSKDSLINEAKARGKLLADQANRIANANGRVVIATIFDVGLTPFGQKEREQQTDIDRAAFLDELSAAFNIQMRLNLLNDGRLIGLVLVDETIQQIARFPGAFGYTDVTQAACRSTVAPQDCTTETLLPEATSTWLWAGDTLLGPTAQQRVGTLALSRAKNNPF
ncbi:MAG: esterase [Rubrivivax sp.]|nr:MAG: esterase [Rubrivivax sp.]